MARDVLVVQTEGRRLHLNRSRRGDAGHGAGSRGPAAFGRGAIVLGATLVAGETVIVGRRAVAEDSDRHILAAAISPDGRPPERPAPVGRAGTLSVTVQRLARPPMPWTWAIHEDDATDPCRRSSRFYRSAEEAWAVGRAVLTRMTGPIQRARAEESRSEASEGGPVPN